MHSFQFHGVLEYKTFSDQRAKNYCDCHVNSKFLLLVPDGRLVLALESGTASRQPCIRGFEQRRRSTPSSSLVTLVEVRCVCSVTLQWHWLISRSQLCDLYLWM